MMRDDDDDAGKPAVDENAGPKIKMGRIGKKKKTNAKPDARTGATTGAGADFGKPSSSAPDDMDTRGNEGFTENDIEFMR